jgi:hypothetical protein
MLQLVESVCLEKESVPWRQPQLSLYKYHSSKSTTVKPILRNSAKNKSVKVNEEKVTKDTISERNNSESLQKVDCFFQDTNDSVKAEFEEYLKKSKHGCLRIDGFHRQSGRCCRYFTGLDRTKPEYGKRVRAKLESLSKWYKENQCPITFVTLTTGHRGLTVPQQIRLLKDCYSSLYKVMNKDLPDFTFVWAMEPHLEKKDGYAHIHLIVFGSIDSELQDKYRKLWITKYNPAASTKGHVFKNSIHFKERAIQRDLKSVANYAFAYVGKAFDSETLKDRDSGSFLYAAWIWKMSQKYNQYKGVKTWDCSRNLKALMAVPDCDTEIDWFRLTSHVPETFKHKAGWFPLWVSEDMAVYPERIKEFDSLLAVIGQTEMMNEKKVVHYLDVDYNVES